MVVMSPIDRSHSPDYGSSPPKNENSPPFVLTVALVGMLFVGVGSTLGGAAILPPSGWGPPTVIEMDTAGDSLLPQVASDDLGNTIVVWHEWDGVRFSIWANRFENGWGWGRPVLLEEDDSGNATAPQVAVNGAGSAVAVWHQSDGVRYSIWSNRFIVGVGWSSPTLLELDDAADAFYPRACVDSAGNATAVWFQSDGARYNIWANRFSPSSGWENASLIETNDGGDASQPRIGVDMAGAVVALWPQSNGSRVDIWTNRFVPSAGWGNASLVETDDGGDAASPQIAVNADGEAVAVWTQFGGGRYNIWSNRFVPNTGWGNASLLENDSGDAAAPEIAIDAAGIASAVWYQFDGAAYSIWANTMEDGFTWGNASTIENDSAGNALFPQLRVDQDGNAIAVWYQSDGIRYNVWSNRLVQGLGWGNAALLETDNGGDAFSPKIAMDRDGNVVAVWHQLDGATPHVWASRFIAPDSRAPPLYVSSPTNGTSTNNTLVWVSGLTEHGATLSVNGIQARVAPDGSFTLPLPLEAGPNLIRVQASDAAGNTASALLTVVYVDPLPALQQQLLDAQLALSMAQSNVANLQTAQAAAQTQLEEAQSNVTRLQERLTTLEGDSNATATDLSKAREDLAKAEATASALASNMTLISNELLAEQDRMAATEDSLRQLQDNVVSLREAREQDTRAANTATAFAILGIALGIGGIVVGLVLNRQRRGDLDTGIQ